MSEKTFLAISVVVLGVVASVAMWRWQVMMFRAFRAELELEIRKRKDAAEVEP